MAAMSKYEKGYWMLAAYGLAMIILNYSAITHPRNGVGFAVGLLAGQLAFSSIPLLIWRGIAYVRGDGGWSVSRWTWSLAVILWIIATLHLLVGFWIGMQR